MDVAVDALGASQGSLAATPVAGNWEGEAASDLWPTFLRIEIGEGEKAKATMFVLGQTVDLGPVKDADLLDAKLGEEVEALRVEGHVEGNHLVGKLSEAGKTFAFSLQRIPAYAPTNDRVVGWSRDLDAIRDRVLVFDRSFDPTDMSATKAAIERRRSELPPLSDDAVRSALRIAAMANNAHTGLYIRRYRTEVRRMPIRAWWFGSELRVILAPAYARVLGCRIDRVGELWASAAKAWVALLFAGSARWRTYMSAYSLTSPEVLHGAGIIGGTDNVRYRFSGCGKAFGAASISPCLWRNGRSRSKAGGCSHGSMRAHPMTGSRRWEAKALRFRSTFAIPTATIGLTRGPSGPLLISSTTGRPTPPMTVRRRSRSVWVTRSPGADPKQSSSTSALTLAETAR